MENRRSATLVLMIVVVGLLNADQNLINATLGAIEQEFHVTDADIGLISGLFTILGAVVSLLVGYLSDTWNRKMLFVYSVLLSEIPCLLTAFSANYGQFFLFRILTGFGVGASFPVIFSLIGDLYGEKERAAAVAWMTTVMGIGQIAGQLVSGYLGPATGWRLPWGRPMNMYRVNPAPMNVVSAQNCGSRPGLLFSSGPPARPPRIVPATFPAPNSRNAVVAASMDRLLFSLRNFTMNRGIAPQGIVPRIPWRKR